MVSSKLLMEDILFIVCQALTIIISLILEVKKWETSY